MARVLSFLIRYFRKYYTLHRSDLAARAVPLDPRLIRTAVMFKSLAQILFLNFQHCGQTHLSHLMIVVSCVSP